jgi:hypothetical protein
VIAVVLLAGVFVWASRAPVGDTDLWAHLKFGQWIVENRALPDHEPFTPFADKQAAAHDFPWLTQAGLYLVYRAGEELAGGEEMQAAEGGVEMLRLAQALLVVLRLAVLLLALARLTGSIPWATAGVVLYMALSFGDLAVLRPQAVGELFFAILLLALARAVLSRRALMLVPLALVVWANCHGSFLVGLLLLALALIGRGIEAGWRQGGWKWHRAWRDAQVRRLLGVLAGSLGAVVLLNPHSIWLFGDVFQWVANPNLHTLAEWQPMDIHLGAGGHWIYLGSLVLLAGSQALSPRALSAGQIVLLVIFGVWPLLQVGMLTWWWLLVPWLVLPLWSALGARLTWSWLHRPSVPRLGNTLIAGLAVVVALAWSAPGQWLRAGRPRPLATSVSAGTPWQVAAQLKDSGKAKPAWLPALTRQLREAYPDGRFTGRIFASEANGDYLLWALAPDYPVLVYTHAHLFPADYWADMRTARLGQPGWWDVLDRYGANLVVVEAEVPAGSAGPGLAAELRKDPAWQVLVDEAGDAAKPDPRTRLLIAVRKHPRILPPVN